MKGKNILIVAGVTVGILVVLEMVSRIVLSQVYDRKFDSSLIEHGKYGVTDGLKANAGGIVWGKAFHTDEMGGRKHRRAKGGKPKLLVIGDSVTEGVGVEDSCTFANLIDESSDRFEAHNISLIGWSAADYRTVVDSLLGHDSTVVQVMIFYCLNDIYGKDKTQALPVMGMKGASADANKFLQENCGLYKLLKLMIYQHSDKYFCYDEALYHDSERLDQTIADIDHIAHSCAASGIPPILVLLPYRSQLEVYNDDYPQRILKERLAQSGILIYDLQDKLRKAGKPAYLYLYADEIHLSPLVTGL